MTALEVALTVFVYVVTALLIFVLLNLAEYLRCKALLAKAQTASEQRLH